MRRKVSLTRQWHGPPPDGVPEKLWPQRRKHRWMVRWFGVKPDGTTARKGKVFPGTRDGRRAAEKFQTAKQAEIDRAVGSFRVSGKVTLGAFIDEFERLKIGAGGQRLKASSLAESKASLDIFARFMQRDRLLTNIGADDVARFVSWLSDRHSRVTANKHKRTIRAALSVAVRQLRYLPSNPFADVRQEKTDDPDVRYIKPGEFAALLTATARVPRRKLWWRAFLSTLYTGGLRYSEAAHLTWADVDFESATIRVSPKPDNGKLLPWTPKSYQSRSVPVPESTIGLLAQLQAECPDGHPYVFIPAARLESIRLAMADGTWPEARDVLNNVRRDFVKIVEKAGKSVSTLVRSDGDDGVVPTVSMHDLRRSAITNWSRATNLQTVKTLAGHANIETTMRYYAAVTDDQLALARQASASAVSVATDETVTAA